MADEHEPCCFDEWAALNAKRARKKEVASGVTRPLLAELERAGLDGRSVLDLGCGAGDLALATLAHGAARATGIDLGPGAIENARKLAAERGLAERATFSVGDGSHADLEPHDVVVLNRVFCCFPDVDGLLDNSLPVAREVYAYTLPVSTGITGAFNRVQLGLANLWFALRRKKFEGFRVFVHDVDAIDRRVRDAGFRMLASARRRVVWHTAVYGRSAPD